METRYEEEIIWLTQKLMAELYAVTVPAINQHLKRLFLNSELEEQAVIKKSLITAAELAKTHAESEFEKYRLIQDRIYTSDFERFLELYEKADPKKRNPRTYHERAVRKLRLLFRG